MTESQKLLAEYVKSGSESAFRRLVELYSGLVYSTALRLADGDSHRAKDVAQSVFIDLARMAEKLSKNSMLGGWLHRHTCFVASTLLRGERRRQAREQQALDMQTLTAHDELNFKTIAPDLDEAIQRLGPDDRDVILLRFFEGQNLRTVGEALGVSENVAQKRVTRALSELRLMLGPRGAAISVASLGTILAAKAAMAAPTGLAAIFAGAALVATAAVPSASIVTFAAAGKSKPVLMALFFVLALTSSLFFFRSPQPVSKAVVSPTTDIPKVPLAIEPAQTPISLPSKMQQPDVKSTAPHPVPAIIRTPLASATPLPHPVQSQPGFPYFRYRAQPKGSQIRIDGDSTVHKWSMEGPIIGGFFELPAGVQIDSVHDTLTGLKDGILHARAQATVPVRTMKSGHDIMDGLYQEALKEKSFPQIVYTLQQMRLKPERVSGQPFEWDTLGDLAIAGVANRIHMPVTLQTRSGGIHWFKGSILMKMSDFGIDPPAPNIGLGLMRCADEVTVSFEWLVRMDSKVPSALQNLALGKVPTSSDTNARPEVLAKITDGNKEADEWVSLRKGAQWVQIDLGSERQISMVALWHAYDTPKTVHNVIIQAAGTPDFSKDVCTLLNNDQKNALGQGNGIDSEYPESAEGKRIPVYGLTARYLRFYSAGSTDSKLNEYTEIEIYGK